MEKHTFGKISKNETEKTQSAKLIDTLDKTLSDFKKSNLKELEKISLKEYNLYIGPYLVLKHIGTGSRSKVLLVENDKDKFAMKVMKVSNANLDDIANEKNILKRISKLNSPFLLHAQDFLQTNKYVFFVSEYVKGLSLEAYMEVFKHFSDYKVAFLTGCIILALEALHSINIFHRDLSTKNLNMNEKGYLKLLDFGFSICPSDTHYGTKISVINNKLVDLQDFTRCVWEMLTRDKINQMPSLQAIEANNKISKEAKYFMINIIQCPHISLSDQGKFLTGLKQHEFFKKIDWAQLEAQQLKSPYVMAIRPTGTSPIAVWQDIDSTIEPTNTKFDEDFNIVLTSKKKSI